MPRDKLNRKRLGMGANDLLVYEICLIYLKNYEIYIIRPERPFLGLTLP